MSQSTSRREPATLVAGGARARCLVRRVSHHVELTFCPDSRHPDRAISLRLTAYAVRRLMAALADCASRAETAGPILVEVATPSPPPKVPERTRDGVWPTGTPRGGRTVPT